MKALRHIDTPDLQIIHTCLGQLKCLANANLLPDPQEGICYNIRIMTDHKPLHAVCIDIIFDVSETWRHGSGKRSVYPFGHNEESHDKWTKNKELRLDLIRYTRLRITRELNRRRKLYGVL
jgi:hypothetical protein